MHIWKVFMDLNCTVVPERQLTDITVRTHLGRLLHPATCNRNLRAAAYLTCSRLVHEIGEDADTTLHRLDLEGVAMSLEIGGFYGGGSEGQRNEFYCKNLR